MAQETAVDFLLEKMSNLGVIYAEGNVLKELNDSIKKAIAMEKEQIKFAYNDGAENMVAGKYKAMEDYYNENYSNENTSTKAD